jgi:quercetin dioxygenase-like cupin family protein
MLLHKKKLMKRTLIALIVSIIFMLVMPPSTLAAVTAHDKPELVQLNEGETFQVGGDFITFKTLNEDTPGELSVIEITAAPQSGPALHKHPPEVFYIVDGEFEFYGAQPEDTLKAKAGDFIHIPSGAPHAYKNIGTTPGKYLLITSMAGNPEQLWFQKFEYELSQKLGTPVTKGKSTQAAPESLSNDDMAAIARKYGIEFLE